MCSAAAARDAAAADARYADAVAARTAAAARLSRATAAASAAAAAGAGAGAAADDGDGDEAAIRSALRLPPAALASALDGIAAACRASGVADGVRLYRRFVTTMAGDPIAATLPHLAVAPDAAARLPWCGRGDAAGGAALPTLAAYAGVDDDGSGGARDGTRLHAADVREALVCDALALRSFLAQRCITTAGGAERTGAHDPFVGVPSALVDAATNVPQLLAQLEAVARIIAAADAPATVTLLRLATDAAYVESQVAARASRARELARLRADAAARDRDVAAAARARDACRATLQARHAVAAAAAARVTASLTRLVGGGHTIVLTGLPRVPS